jgi:hypothetical protein
MGGKLDQRSIRTKENCLNKENNLFFEKQMGGYVILL